MSQADGTNGNNRSAHPAFVRSLPTLPKSAAIRRLEQDLVELGHLPPAAAAIARSVTDPSEFRRQMQNPSRQRIANGALLGVTTTLWAHGVAPLVTNFRMSEDATFPIAGGSKRAPLPKPQADPGGAPERQISIAEPDVVIRALYFEIEELLGRNSLVDSISQEGVRENLLVSVLTIEHQDGTRPVSILVSDDGSSRLSSCYDILDLGPSEVVYTLPEEPRLYRSRIGQVLDLATKPVADATEEDYARLAALVVPAFVAIGFEADDPAAGMDFGMALEYRVGNLHVDPAAAWTDGSRFDSQLSAALDECVRRNKLRDVERRYFEGVTPPEEAVDAGLSPNLDVRAASIQKFFADRASSNAVYAGVRGLLARNSINFGPPDKIRLAVEAAIRPFRADTSRNLVKTSRRMLFEIFEMPELATGRWTLRANLEPSALRDEALGEIGSKGKPGPACRELLAVAAYGIAKYRLIRPTSGGQHNDPRAVGPILRSVLDTEQGIHFLYQVINDVRAGAAPRQVAPDGSLLVDLREQYILADDAWIRATWPAQTPVPKKKNADGGIQPSGSNPERDLAQRREAFRDTVRVAKERLAEVEKVIDEDTGEPLVMINGLSPAFVAGVTKELTQMTVDLGRFQRAWDDRTDAGGGSEIGDLADDASGDE